MQVLLARVRSDRPLEGEEGAGTHGGSATLE